VVNQVSWKPEVHFATAYEGCVAMSGVSKNKFGQDFGLVHEAVVTGRKAGWGEKEWAKLAHDEKLMEEIASVLNGSASIVQNLEAKAKRIRWVRPADTELVRYTKRKNLIHVNLGAPLSLPFDGAKADKSDGAGWVDVELKKCELYVGGNKVVLHLEEGQKNGKSIQGYDLSTALSSKATLHPNILDALLLNQHFIPESWKQDEKGSIRYIFFWAVEFSNADLHRYVRCLCWSDGAWRVGYGWLDFGFGGQHPAVLRAP
jgi:hypothetical protein